MDKMDDIRTAIVDGDAESASAHVEALLAQGVSLDRIMNEGLVPGMNEVGRLYEAGEFYLPEMMLAARAMKAAMAVIEPRLKASGVQRIGKVALGTVQGDIHDIGKNLVGSMLEGVGFQVVDLGVDVPPKVFADAVKEHQPDFVAMSALLSTTMPMMKETIEVLAEEGLRDQAKIMVGGAPVTQAHADAIGADLYAPDASSASRLARRMMDTDGE